VPERIASDHATVESHRVHLTRVGRTSRRQIELPGALSCGLDERLYCSLEGASAYTVVRAGLDGEPTIQDAFRTRAAARSRDGENLLAAWLDDHGLSAGDALVLDVLGAGYAYGLRRPGERVIYTPPEPPNATLSEIADRLDE